MKIIRLIEQPKENLDFAGSSFSFLLSKGEMKSIQGGGSIDCGTYITCGKQGQNSCTNYKDTTTECGKYTFLLPPTDLVLNSGLSIGN